LLCEECKQNEATYTVSVMAGSEVTTRHLCGDCMAKMNMTLQTGNIKNLLSSILSAITGGTAEEPEDQAAEDNTVDVVCPRCQETFRRFQKTGRLGCPGCYEAFREQLTPMLQQIHGRMQHAGRAPLDTREAQQRRRLQEELTRRMEEAVAKEDFETAAGLRDQLRALSQGGDQA